MRAPSSQKGLRHERSARRSCRVVRGSSGHVQHRDRRLANRAGEWGPYAPNDTHVLYLPQSVVPQYRNNLLVFFNGQNGSPRETNDRIYKVAAHQGYYVIGLTYFSAGYVKDRHENEPPGIGPTCAVDGDTELACFGAFMNEVVTGQDCDSMCGALNMEKHPQDAVEMRLLRVLQWAIYNHPNDGWERFLTRGGLKGGGDKINWNLITIAGRVSPKR